MRERKPYKSRVTLSEFRKCSDLITEYIHSNHNGNILSILNEMRIGPNTLNPKGRNFLWWIIEAFVNKDRVTNHDDKLCYLKIFETFIKLGVEIDHQDKYGITALNWSVFYHQEDACKVLLSYVATPDIPDETGRTPFDYAIELFYEEDNDYFCSEETSSEIIMGRIMQLLLQYGADPNRAYPLPNSIPDKDRTWLFMDESETPYLSPLDRLRREAPLLGFETNAKDEPRFKIVLSTKQKSL